ncbi:MAG: outer membrane protein assembly factor BamD [Holosporales bacterium]|jgi:outer membrane protein assembly factor BamD|nr:outer membrane protein assembly factor BamD [Holosporales bacterium]
MIEAMLNRRLIATVSVLLLVGCSKDLDLKYLEKLPVEKILEQGEQKMKDGNHDDAVQIFEELERLYPYSKLTATAQLLAGDCYYKIKKYDEAVTAYEIFIKTHPTHDKVPYALFMLGLINFEQMPIIERDQDVTIKALTYFSELHSRFPQSEYIKASENMILNLRQQMAGREVYAARYYQTRKNYAASIMRLNVVIESYRETKHVPEALHRLIECYVAMGLIQEAEKVNVVLQKSFPKESWARYAVNLLKSEHHTKQPKKLK